ncbi:MAG: hypothetical protein C4325_02185 [Blastocatellia bacterium]
MNYLKSLKTLRPAATRLRPKTKIIREHSASENAASTAWEIQTSRCSFSGKTISAPGKDQFGSECGNKMAAGS